MNHYTARQRSADLRWDYTRNGYATGYCRARDPRTPTGPLAGILTQEQCDAENAVTEPFAARYHTDGHATEEGAQACYKLYLLDQRLRMRAPAPSPSQLNRCRAKGCEEDTAGAAQVGGYIRWSLCDAHRTREVVETLLEVGESWES